jgi:citronellol/citronellal dehydrogenase
VSEAEAIFRGDLLARHVALVTGGGTGLGRATAEELVACGASVVLVGRRAEVVEAAAREIGPAASSMQGDIREVADVERIVGDTLERHGRIDTLVNNAGGQYFAPAEAITLKGWSTVWRLNFEGTLGMSREVAERAMKPAGRGMIVNVTLTPHNGLPGLAHSSSARAAVEAATRDLAAEWAEDGIAVVALAAGHFKTDAITKYPEPVWRGAAKSVPLQRLGEAQEFGWLVTLLASPAGRQLSGSVVTIDGARDNWFGAWPPGAYSDGNVEVPIEARREKPAS